MVNLLFYTDVFVQFDNANWEMHEKIGKLHMYKLGCMHHALQ